MELEFITVGKIVNTHGIRGEVKLLPQGTEAETGGPVPYPLYRRTALRPCRLPGPQRLPADQAPGGGRHGRRPSFEE